MDQMSSAEPGMSPYAGTFSGAVQPPRVPFFGLEKVPRARTINSYHEFPSFALCLIPYY